MHSNEKETILTIYLYFNIFNINIFYSYKKNH